MLITDSHVTYLEWVEQGRVFLKNQRYVSDVPGFHPEIALHSELLGLTHIIHREGNNVVSLTNHGISVLNDDREAWG